MRSLFKYEISTVLPTVLAACGIAFSCLFPGSHAQALEYSWQDIDMTLNNRATIAGSWRMEEQDTKLLGKLNVPGQQNLCVEDDCSSFEGDPEPARRLVRAEGGFSTMNNDNGNMNYDKYDPVAALAKLSSDFNLSWQDYILKVSGVAYYDAVNTDFSEVHNNTLLQPARTRRSDDIERRYAKNAEFREAFIGGLFDIWGNEINISVGQQRLRWGEANLHQFLVLDFINPLDAPLARMPGFSVNEINVPVGLAIASVDMTEALSLEVFYQYDWAAVRPEPSGSFLSINDVVGGGGYAVLGIGQYAEDPDQQYEPAGLAGLITASTRTVSLLDEDFAAPEDGGQYGVKLSWYIEDFMDGTEFAFHFANIHSRFPYASAFAAEASCARDAAVPGDVATALVACQGFNSPLNPVGKEPITLDTLELFLDYPEDIKLFGVSFNNTFGKWSLSGEYVHHRNLPLAVLPSDLIFAAARPGAPPEDIHVGTGVPGLPNLLTIPGADSLFPAQLVQYRNYDPQPGDYVAGYERFPVDQLVIGGIRIYSSSNPIKADQILWLVEAGATYVHDLPDIQSLAFQGEADFTHPTPGADGSGVPEGETINTFTANPHQKLDGYAEDFSWGMRTLIQLTYNNVFHLFNTNVNLLPTILWTEDIKGISPAPAQNYIEGRRAITALLAFEYGSDFTGEMTYQYHGGEVTNLLRDRDHLNLALKYSF